MFHPALYVIDGLGHYVYRHQAITAVAFTAGTVITPAPLRFTDESQFVCIEITALARFRVGSVSGVPGAVVGINGAVAAAGELPDAPYRVRFIESGSDRQMQNNPCDAWQLWGFSGGLRGHLALPKRFRKNSDLQIEYTLLKGAGNAADSMTLEVQLVGYKIYDPAALNLTQHPLAAQLDPNATRV